MSLIYSAATASFLKELTSMSKIPHDKTQRHLKTPKQLRGVRKLYESDTSKFEPIQENREHLIKTLLPMVVKLAKEKAKRYSNSKVEYNDCISAGMQGAVIATDIYIEKSSKEVQPAKLSTYAYSYIFKYITEYCNDVNTILSHGVTKGREAASAYVFSGNQTYASEGNSMVEFFDIANEQSLMSIETHDEITEDIDDVSKTLFKTLTLFDKEVIFLRFGIGSENSIEKQPRDIAKILKCSMDDVIMSLQKSILSMKNSVPEDEIIHVINTIKSSNLSISKDWQRQK